MLNALTAGLLIGLSAAALAGGAALLVLETAALRGWLVALAAGAGIASGDAAWSAVVAAAGSPLGRLLAPGAVVLQWTGVVVVLALWVLAVRALLRIDAVSGPPDAGLPTSPRRAYLECAAFTAADTVTVLFFLSVIVGAAPSYRGLEATVFVGGAFLASLSWQWGAAAIGRRRRRGVSVRTRRIVHLIDIVLLTVFMAYIGLAMYQT